MPQAAANTDAINADAINADAVKADLVAAALAAGFARCGVAAATQPDTLSALHDWLDAGMAGEMGYLGRRREAYADPSAVLPSVRSVVMLALPYRTDDPPPTDPSCGRVSRYAWSGADYHDTIRRRLKPVAAVLHDAVPEARTRVAVDTAPLLERDFARRAGLGWFGKNTMLLSKAPELRGSYFFLAALLTTIELPPDAAHETAHCGTCTRCLDICPTDAFPTPGTLDARRCLSYLTIELRDQPVDESLRPGLGDWVFGCDLCQEVCPWNDRAPRGPAEFDPQEGLAAPDLLELLDLTDESFAVRFGSTPMERTGRAAIVRNACYACGNARLAAARSRLERLAGSGEAMVADAARWAIRQIDDRPGLAWVGD